MKYRLNLSREFIYFLLFIMANFFVFSYLLNLWELLDPDNVLLGGDLSGELTVTKIAYEGNLLGYTKDLAWPYGYSVWSYPLIGLGPQIFVWLLGLVFNNLPIFFVYLISIILGHIINSTAIFWMVKNEFQNKLYPFLLTFFFTFSTFIFYRIGHIPVVWLFFPIVIFGLWLRHDKNQINNKKVFLISLITGIFSPFWWSTVIILLSLTLFIVFSFMRKNFQQKQYFWLNILVSTLLSLIPVLILYTQHLDLVGNVSRNAWQSNVFGGRLSDLINFSPFLNNFLNLKYKLIDGNSPEASITQIGFPLLIAIIISFIFLIKSLLTPVKQFPKDLAILIFVLLLFYLSGGLGNLQAAVFVLLGQESPARSWSRLIILISIIGLYIAFKFLDKLKIKNYLISLILIIFVSLTILDINYAPKPQFKNIKLVEEFAPAGFIRNNTNDCPVFQLPLDTYPVPQDFLFENGGKFFLNQLTPYLLTNKNQWSLGGSPGNKYWQESVKLPNTIDKNYATKLKNDGYCAILFDKKFAKWQIERRAGLNLETGELANYANWPGVIISGLVPNFETARYQVFIL